MKISRAASINLGASLFLYGATSARAGAADPFADLVLGAKNEGDLALVASGEAFGGEPGVRALNDAFNKRFGLNAHISLTPGMSMPAMASRITTEYKGNRPATSAVYIGPISMFVALNHDGVLQPVEWTKLFPWITRNMVLSPTSEGVLARTAPGAIMYSPKVLAPDKAPKRFEDLVDPHFSGAWSGKVAVPPYPDWLAEQTLTWGVDRVLAFAKKLMTLGGGQLRFGEAQPLFDGQYALMAYEGAALELKWTWEDKGVPLNTVFGSTPVTCDFFQLGVPKNSATPNLAKLFVGFMALPEAQAITDKFGGQGSHLIPGTRIYRLVHDNHITLEDPRRLYAFYSQPDTPALYDQLTKIVRQ